MLKGKLDTVVALAGRWLSDAEMRLAGQTPERDLENICTSEDSLLDAKYNTHKQEYVFEYKGRDKDKVLEIEDVSDIGTQGYHVIVVTFTNRRKKIYKFHPALRYLKCERDENGPQEPNQVLRFVLREAKWGALFTLTAASFGALAVVKAQMDTGEGPYSMAQKKQVSTGADLDTAQGDRFPNLRVPETKVLIDLDKAEVVDPALDAEPVVTP